jgi:hypothetical protein
MEAGVGAVRFVPSIQGQWFRIEDAFILKVSAEHTAAGVLRSQPVWLRVPEAEPRLGYCIWDEDPRFVDFEDRPVMPYQFGRCRVPKLPQEEHRQVDSGLGFTCDEQILPFVTAAADAGMKTESSCQEWWSVDPSAEGRRFLMLHDADGDPARLLRFCQRVRDVQRQNGDSYYYCCHLQVDNCVPHGGVRAQMYWDPVADGWVLEAIQSFIGT